MDIEAVTPDDPWEARTFGQLIRAAAQAYGDSVAISLEDANVPPQTASFVELERRSAELACSLLARGVGKGTRIGFIHGNGPAFATILAAVSRIGAIAIPISTMIRSNELVRVLRQSDVAGLIVQRKFLGRDYVERLCEALPGLGEGEGPELRLPSVPFLRWIASSGEGLPRTFLSAESMADGADGVGEAFLREIESEVHPSDQMLEIYTSGSMALPKGVRHAHGPVVYRSQYIARMMNREAGQEIPATMPMFWVGGLLMTLTPNLVAGARTICTEATPTDSRVAMGSVLANEDIELMQGWRPFWGLGMSETLGPYTIGDELRAPNRPMCAPMDHIADRYEVRIADEKNRPVGDGGIGEMQVRGYPVTPGLHKLEREDFFTSDGYYRTGDMCEVEGSRIHFVGRSGDMIKTDGSNVSPAEVELELQALDGVLNAYVVGLPDTERGQIVAAAIVPREGAGDLDFGKIEAELRGKLSRYKVPRFYLQITRDQVPMLHSNKVSRRLLEKMMIEKLGRA